MKQEFTIALAGNPNCGKTCIFNALTGARQHVGNYPGVTVESKSGSFVLNGMKIKLIDLPGVYSLSSGSPEEEVVFQELTRPGIDLIVNVIDSTIPRRSLYLTTQLAELHIPMLLVFNMSDDAEKKGMKFDIPKLEACFGSPIVRTVGSRSGGVTLLLEKLAETLTKLDEHGSPRLSYGQDIDQALMRSDFELFSAVLVFMRGTKDGNDLLLGGQRNGAADLSARFLHGFDDSFRRLIDHFVIVRHQFDSDFLTCHFVSFLS